MNSEKPSILLVRFSSIGDIILTTPVIRALRQRWPDSRISFLVKDIFAPLLRGNPHLDEIIVYDKYRRDRSIPASIRFAMGIKSKNFDLAIIFHPTNRMHIITYLAKIPRRIGYDSNLAFLLTDRIENKKHEGRKRERDYTLDMLKILNIDSEDKDLCMPISEEADDFVDKLFLEHGIQKGDKVVAIARFE